MAITRDARISSARLWTGRVLGGLALLILCAILFDFIAIYLSGAGPEGWGLDAAIRRSGAGLVPCRHGESS
jgi:hypothetical protein